MLSVLYCRTLSDGVGAEETDGVTVQEGSQRLTDMEGRGTEEKYQHDSKPFPVSVVVKVSTNVELLGYKAFPTH